MMLLIGLVGTAGINHSPATRAVQPPSAVAVPTP
jgi:hypothetical protein